jgi:hypothetical protein
MIVANLPQAVDAQVINKLPPEKINIAVSGTIY